MEDEFENEHEAFLVGRYLKENDLTETLECFLKETPIRVVPKMPEDMQSLPQILRDYQKDRQELKEKRRRLQQYEEILNLLFEELKDVYNFQSPPTASSSASPSVDHTEERSTSASIVTSSILENLSRPQDDDHVSCDLDGSDGQVIEKFCEQNSKRGPADKTSLMIPVILPKKGRLNNTNSSQGLCERGLDATEGIRSWRPEGQPVYSRGQALEHHYSHIRARRRRDQPLKYRQLANDEIMPKLSYSKKHVDGDTVDEVDASSGCAGSQYKSCGDNPSTDRLADSCITRESISTEKSHDYDEDDVTCDTQDFSIFRGSPEGHYDNQCAEAKVDQEEFHPHSHERTRVGRKKKLMSSDQGSYQQKDGHDRLSLGLSSESNSSWCPPSHTLPGSEESSGAVGTNRFLEPSLRNYDTCNLNYMGETNLNDGHRRERTNSSHRSLASNSSIDNGREEAARFSCVSDKNDEESQNDEDHADPTSLATETASLLERLLPLVADSSSIKSFMSNLDAWTSRSCPSDMHTHERGCHLRSQPYDVEAKRPQGKDMEPVSSHAYTATDDIMEEVSIDDASSVLIELEEIVGQTVDEILRRYVLVSPLPGTPADPI
ncbi:hypothetical protein KP509_33G007700 [Ceratopteris richardii]|uniref:Uncharacterized protein n=1 Tax=Ceratopteris richardii TaxID=49495 RepID=A0A8T2QN41_CERRI|nr:hypothetical protein KP509_33G007700 [Ceratopteris richardii]